MSLSLVCCRKNTIQIIVERIVDFIWLVIIIAYALMMGACWLPDKGSVSVKGRSINALWKSRELAAKACYDGKSYSWFMHLSLASTPKECVASTNFFDLLLQDDSHSGQLSLVSAEFPTNKSCSTLWSIWPSTVNQRVQKSIPFVFFSLFLGLIFFDR